MNTTIPASGVASSGSNLRQPGLLAWLRLARVYQKVDRISAQGLRYQGLSMAQFDVLAHLAAREGITQQELADLLLVTKGNVCQILDRMEEAGLLLRRQDGRANRLFLTDEGRRLATDTIPRHEEVILQLFSGLTPGEQTQLLQLLRILDRSLD